MRGRTRFILVVLLLLSLLHVHAHVRMTVEASAVSVDDVTSVPHVYDGDTFNTSKGWTIRLADIDAPESWEQGYNESTAYLTALVYCETVYLDVDPLLDPYDRYVCLTYVRHNATHLLNVNWDLVLAGHAEVQNYTNNQFDPADWTRYILYNPVYPIHVDGTAFNVTIISNSTIADVAFNQSQKQLSFTVSGQSTGYCNVTVPKALLGGVFTVLVNDVPVTPTRLEDEHATYLYFSYTHSAHHVKVIGTTGIPEVPTLLTIVPLLFLPFARRLVIHKATRAKLRDTSISTTTDFPCLEEH